ncbi:hypothetical protein E4T43_06184 [Aureobasidium subglaciale]|nr:hypothetical protein E4T43_06184 [Aureobasidium subglaciale]
MSQIEPRWIFSSGSEHSNPEGLHLNHAVKINHSVIIPLRFRFVKQDPIFNEVTRKHPVFQDVIWLPSDHRDLSEKIQSNLHYRLNKKQPKRRHWYCPWRRQQELDIGFRLFITYDAGCEEVINENEVNKANWPDILALLRYQRPHQAVFHADWCFKGERMTREVEYLDDEKM